MRQGIAVLALGLLACGSSSDDKPRPAPDAKLAKPPPAADAARAPAVFPTDPTFLGCVGWSTERGTAACVTGAVGARKLHVLGDSPVAIDDAAPPTLTGFTALPGDPVPVRTDIAIELGGGGLLAYVTTGDEHRFATRCGDGADRLTSTQNAPPARPGYPRAWLLPTHVLIELALTGAPTERMEVVLLARPDC